MNEDNKQISFEIDPEKFEVLEKLSDAFNKTIPDIVSEAVKEYIDLNEWKIVHINKKTTDNEGPSAVNVDSESIFDKFTKNTE